MKTTVRVCLAVGALTLVLVAVGAVVFGSRAQETLVPKPETVAATITTEELTSASRKRLFLGHMSVGKNLLSGVREVYAVNSLGTPEMVELTRGEPVPRLPERTGLFAHSLIGENRDPEGKLSNFDAALRNGVADQVDIAMLKFCYIDIRWDTDVDSLFAAYKQTLDALEKDYPNVEFVHVTTPLTTPPSTIKQRVKALIGRDDNVARERYNHLLRSSYGQDRLFDLAASESTSPDGTTDDALYPGYSTDGAHLNAAGSATAAVGFLRLLASMNRS